MRFLSLSEKIKSLKVKDSNLSLRGATKHRYDFNRLTERDVFSFEDMIGLKLPYEYRDFLKCFGWGAGPGAGLFSLRESLNCLKKWGQDLGKKADITATFQYQSKDALEMLSKKAGAEFSPSIKLQRLDGILPICHYGAGFYIYLVLKGDEIGKVWGLNIEGFQTIPFGEGTGIYFLDWYEGWLDSALSLDKKGVLGDFYSEYLKSIMPSDDDVDLEHGENIFFNKENIKLIKEVEWNKDLKWLSLSYCALNNVPDRLFDIDHLLGLDLSLNNISGMYSSFKGIRNIQFLSLEHNNLKNLPEQIKYLKKLRILDISYNKIDSIPDFFERLEEIEYINASNNRINNIHPSIAKLKKLKSLDLSHNRGIFGLNSLIGAKNIQILDLSGCGLLVFPYYLTMIQSLKELYLTGNDFERLPKEVSSLKNLEILYLNETLAYNLEETIDVLIKLDSLKEVYIPYVELTKFPDNLFLLQNLKKITFYPAFFNRGRFPDIEFIQKVLDKLKNEFKESLVELIY